MKKKFSIITVFILMFSLFFTLSNNVKSAHAASPEIVYSGTLQGTDIHYALDENGLLTVSGTGVIPDDMDEELVWRQWDEEINEIVIKNGITTVGNYTFLGLQNLTKVTFEDSVKAIYQNAFAACTKLEEVVFPETMNLIMSGVFNGCTSLEELVLPNGITYLGGGLVSGCTNLKSLIIPDTVQEFRENIFYNCTSLKNIRLPKNLTQIHDFTFNHSNLEKIYVPCDSTLNFNAEDHLVDFDQDTYLSDTGIEILEGHYYTEWETISGGNEQRECKCGVVETRRPAVMDDNHNKHDKTSSDGVGIGTVLIVIVIIWFFAIGVLFLAKLERRRHYH